MASRGMHLFIVSETEIFSGVLFGSMRRPLYRRSFEISVADDDKGNQLLEQLIIRSHAGLPSSVAIFGESCTVGGTCTFELE
jgi:hypothetical protein